MGVPDAHNLAETSSWRATSAWSTPAVTSSAARSRRAWSRSRSACAAGRRATVGIQRILTRRAPSSNSTLTLTSSTRHPTPLYAAWRTRRASIRMEFPRDTALLCANSGSQHEGVWSDGSWLRPSVIAPSGTSLWLATGIARERSLPLAELRRAVVTERSVSQLHRCKRLRLPWGAPRRQPPRIPEMACWLICWRSLELILLAARRRRPSVCGRCRRRTPTH